MKRCIAALSHPSPSVPLRLSFWWFPRLILGDSFWNGVSCSNKDFGLLPHRPLASKEENFSLCTQNHTPFPLNGSSCVLWLPEELSQGNWCWGPGCGITEAFEELPRACPPCINVCWIELEVSCSHNVAPLLPEWMLTFSLVFHRDWWKRKSKLFPWRTHPSFQRVPCRKGTGYGLATWTPKSQSESESS